LSPKESEPHGRVRDDSPSPEQLSASVRWALNQRAFDNLLVALSPDRDKAGARYEAIRHKLIRFFEWRSVTSPDERADETINRVARRIDEGQVVSNLNGYFYGVARMVLKETAKKSERGSVPLETVASELRCDESNLSEPAPMVACFDRCLEELPPESKSLILEYYQEERRTKIELREHLAGRLGIPLNALRIRAHRIRVVLEKCITSCMEVAGETK
jgi:DNA-directed RNA polymerase specialized sigma24 family protein